MAKFIEDTALNCVQVGDKQGGKPKLPGMIKKIEIYTAI
jgi:hypothetical protein